MRFNLEPGDTFCDGKNKLVTVKINDKERISLPTKAYFSYGYPYLYIYDSKKSPPLGNVQKSIRVKLRDCK